MSSAKEIRSAYSFEFYGANDEGVFDSPRVIVPLVCELFHPQSVVDVGCGTGVWLAVFLENGVKEILGLDGSYVKRDWLKIPADCFRPTDLASAFQVHERFDLAVCLEVAEHLPVESADNLVSVLTTAAPVVLFSAAVPQQGGTEHINEQWPDFWHKKFLDHGFQKLDVIRKEVWLNSSVSYWYRQNIFVYVTRSVWEEDRFASARDSASDLMLVHQTVFAAQFRLRPLLRRLPTALQEFLTNQWIKVRRRAV